MTKPLTFEKYWDYCGTKRNDPNLKYWAEIGWNAALREAVLICNNMDKTYEESAIIDKDVVIEIAAEIESLRK